ncbi:MAG: hypothetical protein ACI89J_003210 [Hyphomicrobiaceae bacterium]
MTKRIIASAFDLDRQRALAVDGAANDLAAGLPGDRRRFPGQHCLVDGTLALDDYAVRGDFLARFGGACGHLSVTPRCTSISLAAGFATIRCPPYGCYTIQSLTVTDIAARIAS